MNAPWPPPTMPRRSRRPSLPSPLPSIAMRSSSADAEHAPVRRLVGALAVDERAEAAGAPQPGLEARVHPLPRARVELGVLDVERLDPLVVDVDEAEIIELLQEKMARVVVDAAARMVADPLEEHPEGGAVHQVLARMDLKADVDAVLVERVEDRPPAPCKLGKRGVDQAGRA